MRAPLFLLLLAALVVPHAAFAQAIPPGVTAEQPLASVGTGLSELRMTNVDKPFVFVHRPDVAPADWNRPVEQLRDVVRSWEVFLLGLGIPYQLIDDDDLEDGLPRHARVLVLPGSELITRRQERQVERFVSRGGGLIAQGRIGLMDDDGRGGERNEAFFRDLFGAEYVATLPPQEGGIFQSLDGSHPVTAGIEPGFLMNLVAQVPTTAALPITAQPLGTLQAYNAPDQAAFDGLTMLMSGQYERGRFVWTRFRPSDVSREPTQQRVYVTLLINALAYVTDVPVASIRPWPRGRASAVAPVVIPLVGDLNLFRPSMTRLMDALEREQAPATFFLTSEKSALFTDIMERGAQIGELALSSADDRVLRGRTLDEQIQRLTDGVELLSRYGSNISGLHPPAGFYDENTIRAMEEAGLRYLLRFPPHPSAAIDPLGLTERADYRETRFGYLIDPDTLRVIGEVGISDVNAPGIVSTEAIPEQITFDDSIGRPTDEIDRLGTSPGAVVNRNAPPRNVPIDPRERADYREEQYVEEVAVDPLADFRTRERTQTRRRPGSRTSAAITEPARTSTPPRVTTIEKRRDQEAIDATYQDDHTPNRALLHGLPTNESDPRFNNRPLRPGGTSVMMTGETPTDYVDGTMADGSLPTPEPEDVYSPDAKGIARPLAQSRRLVAMPILGRTTYNITSNPAIGEIPALQFAAYRDDFLDVHDARGLYVMPIQAELQAKTDEQADVVAQLARYARAEGAWVSTLSQIREWWLQRDRVRVSLSELSEDGVTVILENGNRLPVMGLSVDLFVDIPERRSSRLNTTSAYLAPPDEDERIVLVIASLSPGVSTYRIAFERD